jgi:hypothetical protein
MFVRKELEPDQSRDWDVRATKAIEQARKMPLGHQRSDALKEAHCCRNESMAFNKVGYRHNETPPVFARRQDR